MVMTRPPAYHFWKFLMKNMIPTNSGLSNTEFIIKICMLQKDSLYVIVLMFDSKLFQNCIHGFSYHQGLI